MDMTPARRPPVSRLLLECMSWLPGVQTKQFGSSALQSFLERCASWKHLLTSPTDWPALRCDLLPSYCLWPRWRSQLHACKCSGIGGAHSPRALLDIVAGGQSSREL
eukprot:3381098-Amphidinium_carterae.1